MYAKTAFIFLAAFALISCSKYPTEADVNIFISSLQKPSSNEQRPRDLRKFLKRLSAPSTVREDAVLAHAVTRLADEYLREHDNDILEAVDATQIDAGFATFICGFYHNIKHDEGFLTRYRDAQFRSGVQRCAGTWFSDEKELDVLLQKSPARSTQRK